MHTPTTPRVLSTHRPWSSRLLDGMCSLGRGWWRRRAWRGPAPAAHLDDRTLADLGLDRSELDSVCAEASGLAEPTRQRIAARVACHG